MRARLLPTVWRAVAAGAAALLLAATAGERARGEYDVMAAYLYNFGRFVKWPAEGNAAASFDLCVLGRDPFGPSLDRVVAGETLGGLPAAARRLRSLDERAGCRILFVGDSEADALERTLAKLDGEPILTVSEIPRFAERHGMIGFVVRERRMRFAVNVAAVRHAGLGVSSELLKVAELVDSRGPADP